MEESSDHEGTSVDIGAVVKDSSKLDIDVKLDEEDGECVESSGAQNKDVELKIVEDSDALGKESSEEKKDGGTDGISGEHGGQEVTENVNEVLNGASESATETVKLEEETSDTKAEGNNNDTEITEIITKTTENNDCIILTVSSTDDTKNIVDIAKTENNLQTCELVSPERKSLAVGEEVANIDESDIKPGSPGITCDNTTGEEPTEKLQEDKRDKSTELDDNGKCDQPGEVDTHSVADDDRGIDASLFDDDVFSEIDPEDEEQDPVKKAEVDSFISSVCEELIQGMINAEVEFSQEGVVASAQDPAVSHDDVDATVVESVLESDTLDEENSAKEVVRRKEGCGKMDTGDNLQTDLKNEKEMSETTSLRVELRETRAQLHVAQALARDQHAKHNAAVMSLRLQLYNSEASLRQQQSQSERQLADVMTHLLMLEGQLKCEQRRVKREMKHKNQLLDNQKLEILKLREQNDQLLNAIKEIYAKGGMNGLMRDKNKKGVSGGESADSSRNGKDKKLHNGKLNTVKDKFSWKNRSSLELNNVHLEKYLIKNHRLYSSHEDLHNVGSSSGSSSGRRSVSSLADEGGTRSPKRTRKMKKEEQAQSPGQVSNSELKKSPRNSQNFFYEEYSPKAELSTSVSESSQLSEQSSTSGFQSLSDQDLSNQDISTSSSHHGNNGYTEDDEDERYFSFSSTRINTVIDEEEGPGGGAMSGMGPGGGAMMSMGSMPLLANLRDEDDSLQTKRPHSLSSVDLISIQQQAASLPRFPQEPLECDTPPPSPSQLTGNKNELTPFQTFKTMFKRKGSKNKGHKKRSVSLSQTTSKEYTEAMKKHFQKYDMS